MIQREIEKAGIVTIGVSIVREFTEKVKPPRTIFLKWPFGHPLGEPFNSAQQKAVLTEMFNALYTVNLPGEIKDIPFRWKRETYDNYHEAAYKEGNKIKEITGIGNYKEENKALNVMVNKNLKDFKIQHLIKKPMFWGITAGITLLTVYFLILSIAESFAHSIEQFKGMWYWITLLVLGFGVQAGLYSYIRQEIRLRKHSGAATSSVTAAGGISTTSMVACCAHHITDILPIIGASAAVVFLNQFQNLFLTAGVLSNIIGISLMLKIIQKHGLYRNGQRILSSLMKINMSRSFYFVSTLSAFIFVLTLYKSV